jgi:hypothetical protein
MPRTIADQKRSAKARQHRRRHALADQMVAPGDAMGAGHVAELLGLVRACKGLKISDVLPLSPSGVRVRNVGEPLDCREECRQGVKLVCGE